MIRILLVDDQPITLRFLKNSFSDTTRYEIVGSLTQAQIADIWCEKKKPDVVLLDIQTKEPNINGLKMAKIIKKKFPHIKIIMMTGFDEITYMERAKEIGTDGFLMKSSSATEFIEAVDSVLAGKKVFPTETVTIPVQNGYLPMTARELEFLRLICQDKSNKEIGAMLHISESTVKQHITHLLEKTGKHNRVGLITFVMSGEWINPNI